MIPFFSFINWISALIVGAFGVILYLGSRQKTARSYALVAFATQLWAIGVGSYFYSTDSWWIVFWNQYNHFAAGLIAVSFYIFTIIYPENTVPSRRTISTLVILEVVLFYLYFFTHTIITDAGYAERATVDRYELFFEVGPFFHLTFGVLFILAFLKLLEKKKKYPEFEREISLIVSGTIFGFIPALTAEIILPYAGYYDLYHVAPGFALAWVAFIVYSIAKHRILNIRLVFTEVSILVMSVILFANMLLSEEVTFGIYGRIAIFLAFAVVGSVFIRNIVRKEEQKEQLAKVTEELKILNSSLEEQVQAHTKELMVQKNHSETIIENLTNGLIEYTPSFEIVRMNKAAEELLGVERSVVTGRKITPSDSADSTLETLALITYPILASKEKKPDSAATGMSYAVNELSVQNPRPRELQVVTTPLSNENGEASGFIKVIRDVTGEKKTSREKSEFIGIAAHQLRTPLSGTKWSLNTILEESHGTLLPEQRKALTRAHETNEKMINLVNDLLSAARIEDGRFGYKFGEISITELLASVLADTKAAAEQKGVSVQAENTVSLPPLYADRDKLALALYNLVDNAIHYTPAGGTVKIEVVVTEQDLILRVSDNGMGIKKSDLSSLFTKFFRAENAKKNRTDGTGLGLFIVKNIIARHGGTITVQSKENFGSTFEIKLPRDKSLVPEADETIYY